MEEVGDRLVELVGGEGRRVRWCGRRLDAPPLGALLDLALGVPVLGRTLGNLDRRGWRGLDDDDGCGCWRWSGSRLALEARRDEVEPCSQDEEEEDLQEPDMQAIEPEFGCAGKGGGGAGSDEERPEVGTRAEREKELTPCRDEEVEGRERQEE